MLGGGCGVGFYMDDKRIYLVELRKEFGGIQVVRYAEAEIELADTNLPKEFASQTVRQAFEKAGIRSENIVVALAEKETMTRYFEMPLIPRKEWQNAVRFEAQKYLPFDVRDLYFDFKVITEKARKRMNIMFFAAKKYAADLILEFIHQAGLSVRSMEPVFVSFTRLLFSQQPWKISDVFAIVDISDEGNLNMAVVRGNTLLMTRNCIIRMPPGSAPAANIESFMPEINLSFNYFSKNFKDEKIQYLVLCADTEKNYPRWDEILGNELEMPVKKFYPAKLFGKSLPYSSGLAAAIGAALKTLSSNELLRVNLIPPDKIKRLGLVPMLPEQEKNFLKKILLFGSGALLVFLITLKLSLLTVLFYKTQSVNETKQPLMNQGGLAFFSKDQLETKQADYSRKIIFFDALIGKRVFWTDKMSELARLTPNDMSLSLLDYSDNEDKDGKSTQSLTIEGNVFSEPGDELSAVNRFVAALNKSGDFMKGFEEIKISSIQKDISGSSTATKFILVCLPHAARQGGSQ